MMEKFVLKALLPVILVANCKSIDQEVKGVISQSGSKRTAFYLASGGQAICKSQCTQIAGETLAECASPASLELEISSTLRNLPGHLES
jgi:hypothetical protein